MKLLAVTTYNKLYKEYEVGLKVLQLGFSYRLQRR